MALSFNEKPRPAKVNSLATPAGAERKATCHADGKEVSRPPLTLVALVLDGATRAGIEPKELRALFGEMSEADYTRCFSAAEQYADRNRVMKCDLPDRLIDGIIAAAVARRGLHRAALHAVRAVSDFMALTVGVAVNE
jgi:hypothetical protein